MSEPVLVQAGCRPRPSDPPARPLGTCVLSIGSPRCLLQVRRLEAPVALVPVWLIVMRAAVCPLLWWIPFPPFIRLCMRDLFPLVCLIDTVDIG